MLTPIYKDRMKLMWPDFIEPHPRDTRVAIDAIDNQLRDWCSSPRDRRLPHNVLGWVTAYDSGDLRQYLRQLC